jgi:holo-[acyl-carrier protein] synthase
MLQHIGVDIIEISRFEEACRRRGEGFLRRIFTPAELEINRDRYNSLAARFAAKEAVLKAMDACKSGLSWQDIEILTAPDGKPLVNLLGKAKKIAGEKSVKDLAVTLSHSRDYAVAFAVGVTE